MTKNLRVLSSPATLLLNDQVQTLLDDFSDAFDVRITFFSADGNDVKRGKSLRNCDFCRKIQEDHATFLKCCRMDRNQRIRALAGDGILSYVCHAGLCEAIAPIRKDGELIGFLMIGQFRLGSAVPDSVRNDPELSALFQQIPCYTKEKCDAMLGLFRTLIDYITLRELAAVKHDRFMEEIDRYLDDHIEDTDVRMADMAKKLGRSASYISQFLRSHGSMGFKAKLIERRLAKAEAMWRKNPATGVAEAAYAAGFRDPFYFSRVFRRKRGLPPAAYRDQIYRDCN